MFRSLHDLQQWFNLPPNIVEAQTAGYFVAASLQVIPESAKMLKVGEGQSVHSLTELAVIGNKHI